MRGALIALFVFAAAGAHAQPFGAIEATFTADSGAIRPGLKLRVEGKNGTFDSNANRVDGVPPGTYSVYGFAQSPGFYFVRTAPQRVEVTANAVSRVTLHYRMVLRGTMRLTGALPQYQGLRQLIVDPVRKSTPTHTRTSIGVNGTFDAAGLDPGDYVAKLKLPTHTLAWPVTIAARGVTELHASADLHRIEGDTIDAETGRVVNGADLEVRQLEASARVDGFRVKSNVGHGGGIQISQLPSGRYSLSFSAEGYAPKTLTIDVPRQARLGEVRLQPVSRAIACERKIARADDEDLPVIAAAIRFMAAAKPDWWKNPEPVPGFEFPTELLLLDETVIVPFDDLSLGRVKTLRRKPLWQAFSERASERRSIDGMETPHRIRLACGVQDEPPSALIRKYPKASLAISASLPGILGDEALVYVAVHSVDEGFVVYLERAGGGWKARWHVQVWPAGC